MSLNDAMENVQEFETLGDLIADLNKKFSTNIKKDDVTIQDYCYDDRIGWHTYLVTAQGLGVVGYTDGEFK